MTGYDILDIKNVAAVLAILNFLNKSAQICRYFYTVLVPTGTVLES